MWCEINVLSLSLSLFILFSSFCYCLSSSLYNIYSQIIKFFFFFFVIFLVLVIQSDLERIFKNCDENFHCKHVLIVKDYGKLGILYDEKLGGFIGSKKKAYPHNGRQAFSDPLKNECY